MRRDRPLYHLSENVSSTERRPRSGGARNTTRLRWQGDPQVVAGGDPITASALAGGQSLTLVATMLVVRFGLGPISYAVAAPGGLFAPLLVLGAELGLLFAAGCHWAFPGLAVPPVSFALVGMAAFFAGVVRAPLTGLVLVSEMTGNVTLLLPALGASAVAMLVPALLGAQPIYDTLREALLRRTGAAPPAARPSS